MENVSLRFITGRESGAAAAEENDGCGAAIGHL